MGDRSANLEAALQNLRAIGTGLRVGRIYETAPMYVEDQPPFLNTAALLQVDQSPLALLRALKRIEEEVGRMRRDRFGPREIDLDLIAFGQLEYRYEEEGAIVLQLPHPRTAERRFVLQPLADLDPDLHLPGLGRVSDLLEATTDQAESVQVCENASLSL